jgi:replicative DNA helicase
MNPGPARLASPIDVPEAPGAEAVVVGALLATRHALPYVVDIVTAADFYSPTHAKLFAACLELADVGPWPWQGLVDSAHVRIAAAAVIAGVPISEARHVEAKASVLFDASKWARAVAEASRRRRLMGAAGEVYNRLAAGADVEDVLPILERWCDWRAA